MRLLPASILAWVLVSILPHDALAADPVDLEDQTARSSPLHVTAFIGGFSADDNSGQLRREGSGYGWGLTAGYSFNTHIALEGEFLWFRREYERVSDTVIPGTADNDQRILTLGVSALAKVGHSFGRWRPFIGVGAGVFDTEPFVTDPESGKFTTNGAPSSESSVGYQFEVGVAAKLRNRFHVELGWKTLLLEEDFGIYSNGEADLGGSLFYIAARGGGR